MNGVVNQGDIAFIGTTTDLFDGCIAAVRLKDGGQIIKRFHRMKNNTYL